MDHLLTISEVAKHIGIPDSTARYYRDRFSQYVPCVGEGRNRRYKPETVAVLRVVADGMKANHPVQQIESVLASQFPINADHIQQQPSVITQQQPAAEQQQAVAMLGAMVAEITNLRSEMVSLKEEVSLLRQEQSATMSAMENNILDAVAEAQTGVAAVWGKVAELEKKKPGLIARLLGRG
jgi:DNA-binding transcriptional MerR regulator